MERAVGGTQGELDLNTALVRLVIPVVVMGPKLAMGRQKPDHFQPYSTQYGNAYASVASVVCTECIMAKWCVLEKNLLLTAYRKSYNYEKSIDTKINELDRGLIPKDHQQEMAYG